MYPSQVRIKSSNQNIGPLSEENWNCHYHSLNLMSFHHCREPMLNTTSSSTSKQTSGPEDMDALCKLLLSDFKVKDDQDYIIDEIVAAFDRQNFTNKGFLAKVSDQQQKYLVSIGELNFIFSKF